MGKDMVRHGWWCVVVVLWWGINVALLTDTHGASPHHQFFLMHTFFLYIMNIYCKGGAGSENCFPWIYVYSYLQNT